VAYIFTSKFSDYCRWYRLEVIFALQGFAISRAMQSVSWGEVAERVRASHVVATGDPRTAHAQRRHARPTLMWV